MNTDAALRELELAAWEQAEAESHERAAKSLRIKAAKRVAAVHSEMKSAMQAARENHHQIQNHP